MSMVSYYIGGQEMQPWRVSIRHRHTEVILDCFPRCLCNILSVVRFWRNSLQQTSLHQCGYQTTAGIDLAPLSP